MKGLLLLDVMTHPEYRRRGIFAGVVEGLRERAAAESYRLLLTTPNRAAERGFQRLPGWRRMGELEPWVFPGDPASLVTAAAIGRALLAPAAALRRALVRHPHQTTPTLPPDDGALDGLWEKVKRLRPNQVVRDARFLRWRFGPGSGRSYTLSGRDPASEGGVLAVTHPHRMLHRDVILLTELLVAPGCEPEATETLRTIAVSALDHRAAAVVGWFAPNCVTARPLRLAGFHRVPVVARPRPYRVWAATDMPPSAASRALDLRSWHMTMTDSDLG